MRIPHAEFLGIAKQNKPRTLTLMQRPRMTAGRAYTVTSVEKVEDGVVRHKRRVTCLAVERVQVQDGEQVTDVDAWRVTLVKDDVVDHVKLLKARPGRSDYTDRPALALPDEPEAVSDMELARQAKDARTAEQRAANYEFQQSVRRVEAEIDRLEQHAGDANRGRIQRLRAALRTMRDAA